MSTTAAKYCKDAITFYDNGVTTITDMSSLTSTEILLSLTPSLETVDTVANTPVLALSSTHTDAASSNTVIRNVHNPELDNDAATKAYVDGLAVSGVTWKNTVIAASTTNIAVFPPVNVSAVNPFDGITLVGGERVLIKDQTNNQENGIWITNASGAWTRAPDMTEGVSASGFAVWVDQGTSQADSGYVVTTSSGSDVVGNEVVDSGGLIVWAKFSSTATVSGADGDLQFALGGGHDSASGGTLNWDDTNFALTVSGDASGENALIIGTGDLSLTEGDIFLSDAGILNMGSANELTINHTGSAGSIDNTVGNLNITQTTGAGNIHINNTAVGDVIIENSGGTAGDDIIVKLGDAAGSTNFTLTDSADVSLINIDSDGAYVQSLGSMTLVDTIPLNLGTDSDLILVHSGAAGSITNSVGVLSIVQSTASQGELLLENSGGAAGDDITLKLGDTAGATSVNVTDSADKLLFEVVAVEEESTSAATGTVRITGGLGVTGDITATCVNTLSDATTKTNITPMSLSDPMSKIRQVEGYNYEFLPGYGQEGKLNSGVLAQQIETIPGLEHCINTCANTGYKSVNYTFLTPFLIEGMKQQQKQIDELLKLLKK